MNHMFYFLLALTTVLATTADAVPIVDIDGNIIFQGSYYAFPVDAEGGGLTLSGHGGKPCPLDVVQESNYINLGIPIKFSNWRSKVGFVPEGESLDIEMDTGATICGQSTYLWVEEREMEKKMWIVTTGPKPEEFEKVSLNSLFYFQIEKSGLFDSYKFVACPRSCTGSETQCRDMCMDVGIFEDEDGVRRLALSSDLSYSFSLMSVNVVKGSSKYY